MNIAKSYFQLHKYGLAIKYISIYLALIAHNNNNNNNNNNIDDDIKKMAEALYIKAKCFLNAGRPNISKKIATKLSKYDKQRSDNLIIEIEKFLSKRNKENKQLAKHIASWVDTAMNIKNKHERNDDKDDIYLKGVIDNDDIDDKVKDQNNINRSIENINNRNENEKCNIS